MGHRNLFGFVPMKKSVQTLEEGAGGWWRPWEGEEGSIRHTAFAFISGKMVLAKVNYIYGTTFVPVKKQVIRSSVSHDHFNGSSIQSITYLIKLSALQYNFLFDYRRKS